MKRKLFALVMSLCFIIPCAFLLNACGDDLSKNNAYFTIATLPTGVESVASTESFLDTKGEYKVKGESTNFYIALDDGYEINTLKILVDGKEISVNDDGLFSFTAPDHNFEITFSGETKIHQSTIKFNASLVDDLSTELSKSGKSIKQVRNEYSIKILQKYISSDIASSYNAKISGTYFDFVIGDFAKMISENEVFLKLNYGEKIDLIVSSNSGIINIPDFINFDSEGSTTLIQKGESGSIDVKANSSKSRTFTVLVGWLNGTIDLRESLLMEDSTYVDFLLFENSNALFDLSFIKNSSEIKSITFVDVEDIPNSPISMVLTLKEKIVHYDDIKQSLKNKTIILNINEKVVELTTDSNGNNFNCLLDKFYNYSAKDFKYSLSNVKIKEENKTIEKYLKDNQFANVLSYNKEIFDGATTFGEYMLSNTYNAEGGEVGRYLEGEIGYTVFAYSYIEYLVTHRDMSSNKFTENEIQFITVNGAKINVGTTNETMGISLIWDENASEFFIRFDKTLFISSLTIN